MASVIHGLSHKALKHFRAMEGALAVYWIYCSRVNKDNVAWPSVRGLAHDTGWDKSVCGKYRSWLIDHKALEVVKGYVRPQWRDMDAAKLKQRLGIDKSVYLRPTGVFVTDTGETLDMLYVPGSTPSEVDEPEPDEKPPNSDSQVGDEPKPDIEQTIDETLPATDSDSEQPNDVQLTQTSQSNDVRAARTLRRTDTAPHGHCAARTELNTNSNPDSKSKPYTKPPSSPGPSGAEAREADDDGDDDDEKRLIGQVFQMFEDEKFGSIRSAVMRDDITDICTEYGVQHVLNAMRETVLYGARNKWPYTLKILKNRREEEVRKKAHGDAHDEQLAGDAESQDVAIEEIFDNADALPEPFAKVQAESSQHPDSHHWQTALYQIELQLDHASFGYLRGTALTGVEGELFTVACEAYAIPFLQNRLYKSIRRILSDVVGREIELKFVAFEAGIGS